ncbi:MAG: DNA-3-methyladenine glycosylase [Labilithrix sp.]|nr:DNA-3-methyladenine glycosylase [Labilithrix sp.]
MSTDAPLPRAFYERDALVVARALVGTYLVHGEKVARIVETEAYRGPKDLACHAKVGLTKRTKTLYGPPGRAYVFLIYGMYECFNVVCFGEGKGHAVLVRGVEPVRGIAEGVRTDGPGRATRALGITRAYDAADLVTGPELVVTARTKRPKIAVSARVGVGYAGAIAEAPWRFFDATSKHVSRPHPRTIGLGPKGGA